MPWHGGRLPCEDTGRDWMDVSTNQRIRRIAGNHWRLEVRHGRDSLIPPGCPYMCSVRIPHGISLSYVSLVFSTVCNCSSVFSYLSYAWHLCRVLSCLQCLLIWVCPVFLPDETEVRCHLEGCFVLLRVLVRRFMMLTCVSSESHLNYLS